MTKHQTKPTLGDRISALRVSLKSTDRDGGEWQKEFHRGILDLCEEMAVRIGELEEAQEELDLYLETIDDDLACLERNLYGGEEGDEGEELPLLETTQARRGRDIEEQNPAR